MTRTKTNTHNNTKHVEHKKDATDYKKKKTVCFSDFSVFIYIHNFLNGLSKKC